MSYTGIEGDIGFIALLVLAFKFLSSDDGQAVTKYILIVVSSIACTFVAIMLFTYLLEFGVEWLASNWSWVGKPFFLFVCLFTLIVVFVFAYIWRNSAP